MLMKLLDLITKEGRYRPVELAQKLDTSPELVEQAVELLVEKGYLKPLENCSDESCGGCSVTSACKVPKPRVWVRAK